MGRTRRSKPHANHSDRLSAGGRLAELRKQHGYTQKDLAEKIGIAWTLISDYERGKLRLHDQLLVKVARVLGVSADELLGLGEVKEEQHRPSLRIARRLNEIESLSVAQQKTILRSIDLMIEAAKSK